jgi:phage minor structural protein
LQSIAETFNAWLSLEIIREDNGAIDQKYISFHNYMGKNNYAGFKHGINLKDIQRTFESKQIVTKLIVKDNNN